VCCVGISAMDRNDAVPFFDVIIIGAGWSGVMACKYCFAERLKPLVLEGRDSIGGVWAFTQDGRYGGVMTTTETTSSRCVTEISDFPMPGTYPEFPSHVQILEYLKAYSDRFDLNRHIRLNHRVESASKVGDVWQVTCANGEKFRSKSLLVSSGVHQHPNDVSGDAPFNRFTGRIFHSATVKAAPTDLAGKTVVIWGGGESASDIAVQVSKLAARTYWCIPNGQWFVPKVVDRWWPFPSSRPKVGDQSSSRVRLSLSPTFGFSPFINQYLQFSLGFNGHGQEAWRTHAPYHQSFFNKSYDAIPQVKAGKIVAQRDIERCEGHQVYFADGSAVQADAIITCSGYKLVVPFLAPGMMTDPQECYKYIFGADPSLAFVGFVRPVIGSIPAIAELQSRYVAMVFAGRRTLPPLAEREHITRVDAAFWNQRFRFTSRRLRGLVDLPYYCDQIARLIGCRPRFWRLLFTAPRTWWWAVSTPWNGCQFWLNDESHHERIFATFARYRFNQVSEVYILLALIPILPFVGLISFVRLFINENFVWREKSAPRPAASGARGRRPAERAA
jgi:dimethylaniline monooxygenase (N-oxide forming) / hypotaurine monooxygenase